MRSADSPANETSRLEKLRSYDILDTDPEQAFDRITRIVAETIGVHISLVSLIDEGRQWFKSHHGLDATETPREMAFCAHAILDEKIFIIEDARKDPRFADNPLVTGAPEVIFYAGAPLITSDGLTLGTLCAIDNKPHKLEPAHAQLLEDLATLVIDEMELRKAIQNAVDDAQEQARLRKKAEVAEVAKSRFLTSMSHEIRTPLNAIIGLTNLVLKTNLSSQQQEHLSRVSSAGRGLLGLINDILDFSKIEAGMMLIDDVDFHIDEVLTTVSSVVSSRADVNKVEVLFDIDHDVPREMCSDPLRIGQILTNLVGNAVKFTRDGEVLVHVTSAPRGDHDVSLMVSIQDTGIGMSEEQIEQLFKPFTQADQSVSRNFGGTGLGLAISKQLVEAMDGSIAVESQPGRGSVFSFTIPVKATVSQPAVNKVSKSGSVPTRILVVDDNKTARNLIAKSLQAMAFHVKTAASGIAAIDLVSRSVTDEAPYDFILMDSKMPEMSGIEAIRHIQKLIPDSPTTTLFMMTSSAETDEFDELAKLGIDEFLNKPINTSLLSSRMVELTDHKAEPLMQPPPSENELIAIQPGARVLVVEDNEINQLVAGGLLEDAGFQVDFADNGEIAIQLLQKGAPDAYVAVLMNIQMPVMDGLRATQILRADPALSRLPIIAVTAHAMTEERDRCRAVGMNGHIAKPFEPIDVVPILNTICSSNETINFW